MRKAGLSPIGLRRVGAAAVGVRRPGAARGGAVDPITQWFRDTGTDGLYVDGQAGGALFQDAARTQPAAVGDPVGGLTDLSGNGYHASLVSPAGRPLRTSDGLAYDGIDDRLSFGNVLTFGTESFTMMVLCNSSTAQNANPLSRRGGGTGAPGWGMRTASGKSLIFELDDGVPGFPFPIFDGLTPGLRVLTLVLDRGAQTATGRQDGVQLGQSSISGLGDITGSRPLTLGSPTGSFPYLGTMRAAVVMAGTDYQVVEQSLLSRLP